MKYCRIGKKMKPVFSPLHFVCRYKYHLTEEQLVVLQDVLRGHFHPQITPEIRRELQAGHEKLMEKLRDSSFPSTSMNEDWARDKMISSEIKSRESMFLPMYTVYSHVACKNSSILLRVTRIRKPKKLQNSKGKKLYSWIIVWEREKIEKNSNWKSPYLFSLYNKSRSITRKNKISFYYIFIYLFISFFVADVVVVLLKDVPARNETGDGITLQKVSK